jgi:SAM-dependent methyltransferase
MTPPNLFEKEKNLIAELVRGNPVASAMFHKNWRRYATVVDFMLKNLQADRSRPILDYGSGYPFVSKLLLTLGFNVCSYEPYATDANKAVADALGMGEFYASKLPEDSQFDTVLMVDVIEHLSVIRQTMQDVNRRTSRGGMLVVSTPNVMRIEMWLRFLLRQTGHPQPIQSFVKSDNNYVEHQREFTMAELQYTLKHYGFRPVVSEVAETQPDPALLARYHSLLGQPQVTLGTKQKVKEGFFQLLRTAFPRQFANNLLVAAEKTSVYNY